MQEILRYFAPTGLVDFVDLDISVEPNPLDLMTTSFFEPKLQNAARVAAVGTPCGRWSSPRLRDA